MRAKILGDLPLAATLIPIVLEIVADLRCDDDLVTPASKSFRDEFLAPPVSIGIGGVKERHTKIESLVH